MAFATGVTLGRRYLEQRQRLRNIVDAEERVAFELQIQQSLRDPALDRLGSASSSVAINAWLKLEIDGTTGVARLRP